MSSLPNHAILVHFPIALGVLLPILSLLILIGCRKGWFSNFTWILVPLLLLTIVGTGWLAKAAGRADEDIVEKIVSEDAIEAHENFAVTFWRGAIGMFVLSLVPLGMTQGRAAVQSIVVVGSIGLLWPLVNAGHSGGELVYRLGAASAHVEKYKAEALSAAGNSAVIKQPDSESDNDSDED